MSLADTFRQVNDLTSEGRVRASFYPYRELKHTWRLENGVLSFKVSDYMKGAPDEIMESLAWYLVCRARRKECPAGMAARYKDYVRSRSFWEARRQTYLGRAKNLSFRPRGECMDLEAVFSYVNANYFGGAVDRPSLAWARESPRTRMGFYHSPLRILAVNRALDTDWIPRYVLEFVMYHELLHDAVDQIEGPFRRTVHTREFRAREQRFARHDDAQRWISRIASGGRRGLEDRIVPQV